MAVQADCLKGRVVAGTFCGDMYYKGKLKTMGGFVAGYTHYDQWNHDFPAIVFKKFFVIFHIFSFPNLGHYSYDHNKLYKCTVLYI